jgi:hypothetical protein
MPESLLHEDAQVLVPLGVRRQRLHPVVRVVHPALVEEAEVSLVRAFLDHQDVRVELSGR